MENNVWICMTCLCCCNSANQQPQEVFYCDCCLVIKLMVEMMTLKMQIFMTSIRWELFPGWTVGFDIKPSLLLQFGCQLVCLSHRRVCTGQTQSLVFYPPLKFHWTVFYLISAVKPTLAANLNMKISAVLMARP